MAIFIKQNNMNKYSNILDKYPVKEYNYYIIFNTDKGDDQKQVALSVTLRELPGGARQWGG